MALNPPCAVRSCPPAQNAAVQSAIQLSDISKVDRTDLKKYCLLIEANGKRLWLAFRSDGELYGWQDDIRSCSPLMGVSDPVNFVHKIHVGFDPVSRAFTGMPQEWSRVLTQSVITREDYDKGPGAILEFYTDQKQQNMEECAGIQPDPIMFTVRDEWAGTDDITDRERKATADLQEVRSKYERVCCVYLVMHLPSLTTPKLYGAYKTVETSRDVLAERVKVAEQLEV
jgi:hypothetical protein